jgi:Gas vesicle protein G
MGLVGELLLLPLAPVRGTGWVLRQVVAQAEAEFYDPAVIQRELAALEARLEAAEIDEAEFDRLEDALLDRLEEANRRRTGQATATDRTE